MMRAAFKFTLLLLLLLFLSIHFILAEVSSKITTTEHFVIYHPPDLRIKAELIGQASESWLQDISKQLDFKDQLEGKIAIHLYRNQGEFKKSTGYDRPGQVLGIASTEGYIQLDASDIFAPAGQVAGHEIVHVIVFRIMKGRYRALPLWLNEGAAKYLTGEWDHLDGTILANAVSDNSLLPLSKLNDSFPKGEEKALAYSESASAVKYLADKYGKSSIARIVHETAESGSFTKAFHSVTGMSIEQFESEWRKEIEGNLPIVHISRLAKLIGAILMPLLIITALWGAHKRRQRIMKRFEEEEWEAANRRDWGLD